MTKQKFRLLSLLGKFREEERGAIMVQFTVFLVVFMGMIGLALDGARYLMLNNSLQDLADAAALAGAAQLDGSQDAQTRATNAAQAIANKNPPPGVAYDAGGSTTITTTFYNGLNPDTVANGPKDSYYIKATTASSTTNATFLLAASRINKATRGTAIAQGFGNNAGNCAPTQSFFCNPFESTATNPGNANNFASNLSVGTMVHLVNGASAAGNWGLLQPPSGNNNPHEQTPFWAESNTGGQCITGPTQANTRTGNVAKDAQSGMNVRFDSPVGSGAESLSAPIVIDGFNSNGSGFNCNRIDPNQGGSGTPATPAGFAQTDTNPTAYDNACNNNPGSCPLPRDRTFINLSTGNAAWSQMLVGNGPNIADLQAYWKNHHSGSLPAGVTTRYQIYRQEVPVTQGGLGTASFTAASDTAEPHGPVCNKSTVGTGTAALARRVLNVAVVDCTYWGITGHSTPIPSTSLYAQFFMTEPALNDGSIFAEYIGCYSTSPINSNDTGCNGSNNTGIPNGLHTLVQLVR
jgi:Flp pilus assembly protein TadG